MRAGALPDGRRDCRWEHEINQAPITGGPPDPKQAGDPVISGTINGQGVLKVRVSALAQDTTVRRIVNLVLDAREEKARQEKFIDRFAAVYTPIVVAMAVLTALVPTLFFRRPLWNSAGVRLVHRALFADDWLPLRVGGQHAGNHHQRADAARAGVIFKGGVYLETLGQSKLAAFDKTGTLTLGKPVIRTVKAVDCEGTEQCEPCADLLALASSLEYYSTHPLGQAVMSAANERDLQTRYGPAEKLESLNGKGRKAT